MSFFFIENFNLPNGVFQPSIVATTGYNGMITQADSTATIQTFIGSDSAIITNADGHSCANFHNTPIRIKVGYNVTSISTGSLLSLIWVTFSNSPIVLEELGTAGIRTFAQHQSGTANHIERWQFYTQAGSAMKWRQNTTSWVTSTNTFVRAISTATDYYLDMIIDPITGKAQFDNGTQKTTTNSFFKSDEKDFYFFMGDSWSNAYYGTLKINYINVIDIGQKYQLRSKNNLFETKRHSRSRVGGAILTEVAGYNNQNRIRLTEASKIYGNTFNRIQLTEVNNA